MSRANATQSGYMELDGAKKDADCEIVQIAGGVSKELGCCNMFKPKDGANRFHCGSCKEVRRRHVIVRK